MNKQIIYLFIYFIIKIHYQEFTSQICNQFIPIKNESKDLQLSVQGQIILLAFSVYRVKLFWVNLCRHSIHGNAETPVGRNIDKLEIFFIGHSPQLFLQIWYSVNHSKLWEWDVFLNILGCGNKNFYPTENLHRKKNWKILSIKFGMVYQSHTDEFHYYNDRLL